MSCKICGRGACASFMHNAGEQALADKLEDMTPRQAYDLGYDKAVEEAASPPEADQRDAARYRWLRDHDMSGAYDEYTSGNLNGRGVDPLDSTIDAAMRNAPLGKE